MPITLKDVAQDCRVQTYIAAGNEYLGTLGFTEHSFRHVGRVASISKRIMVELGYPQRIAELAEIAGYMHDLGSVVSRHDHGQSGALIAFSLLSDLKMDPQEIVVIVSAIGNHEEEHGQVVSEVSASLIIADKSDVARERVRNPDFAKFDIHDRVNFAATSSEVVVNSKERAITLDLKIDTEICPVMEYFEIFLTRMMMCRRAAGALDGEFRLIINDARLL